MKKKTPRRIGGAILDLRLTAKIRARSHLAKMENIALVDTQAIRAKLLKHLQSVFDLAISIAKGKVKHLTDEDGKPYKLTLRQREKWARIAAYAAQTMNSLTLGYDEKQFQTDLKKLEAMVAEVQERGKAGKKDQSIV